MKHKKAPLRKVVPLLLCTLLLSSCSAATKSSGNRAPRDAMEEMKSEPFSANYGNGFYERTTEGTSYDIGDGDYGDFSTEEQENETLKQYEGRKIIYSSWFNINTKEYDAAIEKLNSLCDTYGAYFESAQSYGEKTYSNRYSTYVVRIPSDHYKAFIESAGTLGTVTGSGEDNRDVTEQYFDTQARLDSAALREERLLAILEKADTLDDVLLLERELSDVRYEIESLTGELKKLDSLVSYSTATVSITEVKNDILPDSDKQTLATRLSLSMERGWGSFREGLADFAVEVVYSLPVFLCVGLPIILLLILLFWLLRKKRKKRRAARLSASPVIQNPNVSASISESKEDRTEEKH